jgi:hypothetical protein
VGNIMKLSNAKAILASFATKIFPPRQASRQNRSSSLGKSFGCSVIDTEFSTADKICYQEVPQFCRALQKFTFFFWC